MKDDQLWVWFSRYVRLKHSNAEGKVKCFTCGDEQDWNSGGMHAGHFISRRHQATKYSLLNCHPQCAGCNAFQGGRQYEYSVKLDEVYGPGTAQKIYLESRTLVKRGAIEIKEMTRIYRDMTRNLLKEKHLKML